jgi:hypothetical protein
MDRGLLHALSRLPEMHPARPGDRLIVIDLKLRHSDPGHHHNGPTIDPKISPEHRVANYLRRIIDVQISSQPHTESIVAVAQAVKQVHYQSQRPPQQLTKAAAGTVTRTEHDHERLELTAMGLRAVVAAYRRQALVRLHPAIARRPPTRA